MPPCLANIFVLLVETDFLHIGQADLELLTSSDSPSLAPQSVEITGVSHHAHPRFTNLLYVNYTSVNWLKALKWDPMFRQLSQAVNDKTRSHL